MLSRRTLLATAAGAGFATALPSLAAHAADPDLKTTLDAASEELLTEYPEDATFLGLDADAAEGGAMPGATAHGARAAAAPATTAARH